MDLEPLISIIIPVYNAEKYLEQCLNSVISQNYRNIEVICVNDGSEDESLTILEKYRNIDNRIIVIDKKNEGVSVARNTALDIAKGDYILFIDSDDWIEFNTCDIALQKAFVNNADVVMWPYIREFPSTSSVKSIFNHDILFENDEVLYKLHRRFIGVVGDELEKPENADALCTIWGKLYKSSLIQENNVRFIDIKEIGSYEDGLFNLEVFKFVKKAFYFNEYLYHYRKGNSESVTTRYVPDLEKKFQNLFGKMKKYLDINHLPEVYYQALNNRIALSSLGLGLNIESANFSFFKKIRKLNTLLHSDWYSNSSKQLELKYFPVHWKVFYWFSKNKITLGVYALIKAIAVIR